MNEDILVKFALIRYALLPRQLLAFDEAYGKDCYEFDNFFKSSKELCIEEAQVFLDKIKGGLLGNSYLEDCKSVALFISSMPFVDTSSFSDLNEYNPFDDFEKKDFSSYLLGRHIPDEYEAEEDEASIFYANSPESFYNWYNSLEDKTLMGLLQLYIALIRQT